MCSYIELDKEIRTPQSLVSRLVDELSSMPTMAMRRSKKSINVRRQDLKNEVDNSQCAAENGKLVKCHRLVVFNACYLLFVGRALDTVFPLIKFAKFIQNILYSRASRYVL